MAFAAFQLACPHCSARLRIRDKSYSGRTVNCPDCRRPLTIQSGANGELIGVVAAGTPSGGSAVESAAAIAGAPPGPPRSSPATWVAWGIALAGFAAVLLFVMRGGDDVPPADVANVAPPVQPPPEQPPEPQPAAKPPVPGDPAPPAAPPDAESAVSEPPSVVESSPEPAPPDPVTAPPDGPDSVPIEVALAPDGPRFDIGAALDQPLVGFDQPTPAPAGELLKLVGELAGVAVDTTQLSAAAAERLKRPLTLTLNDTSVRGVLDAIAESTGLSYSLGEGSVVVLGDDP